jgi:hypothetical protein
MGELTQILMDKLLVANPYQGFEYQDFAMDLQGGAIHPVFRQMIEELRPQIILEVGTWKGVSAIHMASLLKEMEIDGAVICIDTWLGGLEHLFNPSHPVWGIGQFYKHGYPTLYYQFLANVMHRGMEDTIVPLPNTSGIAARWLLHHHIQAGLIYIDGSHDEDDVYQDLVNYWKLLKKGGVMFGDDWNLDWVGVICAVNRFVKERQLQLQIAGDKWGIQKRE